MKTATLKGTYAFVSLGCPKNTVDSERMLGKLAQDGYDPFHALHLPQAALAFRQGFGRLIRRRDDRGIAAVLDGRLVGRAYGRVFVNSLPPDLPRTSIVDVVRRWWHGEERPGARVAEAG